MHVFLPSGYGFVVFGYMIAALPIYFIERDAENAEGEVAGAQSTAASRKEIAALRPEVRTLLES